MPLHYDIVVEWLALAKASAADLNVSYIEALGRKKKLHKLKVMEEKLDEEFMFADNIKSAYLSDLLDENLNEQIDLGNPEKDLEEIMIEQVDVQKEIETVKSLLKGFNRPPNQVTDQATLSS